MTEYVIPNYSSALREDPELAQLVGIYISTFPMAEMALLRIFSHLTKSSNGVAHTILNHFVSVSHRITLTEDFATQDEEARKLLKRLKSVNKFRNKITHSLYALEKDSNRIIVVNAVSKKKPVPERITAKQLESELKTLELLLKDIGRLAEPDAGPKKP